jgi:hypothetical protein
MNRRYGKLALILLVIASLVALPLLSGCADDGNGNGNGDREIILGGLLDFSGAASEHGSRNAVFWDYMIQYTNEFDPIIDEDGNKVTLKMVYYDNEYDPAKVMIGYRSLMDRDPLAIIAVYPQDGEILKSRLAADRIPMYLLGPSEDTINPPGWIFGMATTSRNQMEFLLTWLEEDWDYEAMGRNPKIGMFGWNMSVSLERLKWSKLWVDNNPDKFDWIGEEIGPMGTMSWFAEANRLKDADYLIVGTVGPGVTTFINEAARIGYEGEYVVDWPQVALGG